MNYRNDFQNFLQSLDSKRQKTIYAKITTLTFDELPIDSVEGRVTQGSINIDGASAIRRTCSLTMVAKDIDYSNYIWSLNTKFKLEIGVYNDINPAYPDIIWFKQGIYVLTSFNTSHSVNSYTLSLQGKDKMCLLNGEIGGALESAVDFGTIEEENADGNWSIRKIPLQDIIKHMINVYGGEPLHNIMINDLDTYGLELLEYRYDMPMYLYRENGKFIYTNALLESDDVQLYNANGNLIQLKDLTAAQLESLTETLDDETDQYELVYSDQALTKGWYFTKVEYGQTAGYRLTDLTYAGDLIVNVGEALTSGLDKIKNMLVEFEYFYDVDGHFIFQKKKSFIQTLWRPQGDMSVVNSEDSGIAYYFTNNDLVTAFNNTPAIANVRNDYSIWGQRESSTGAQVPIHLRYAIDSIPQRYQQIVVSEEEVAAYNKKYGTALPGRTSAEACIFESSDFYSQKDQIIKCDWREVLYQMALDYFRYNHLDDFEIKVANANPLHYSTGKTGYEQYYTDIQGFWRQLYYPGIDEKYDEIILQEESLTESIGNKKILIYGHDDENGIHSMGLIDDINYMRNMIANNPSGAEARVEHYNAKYSLSGINAQGCIDQMNSLYLLESKNLPVLETELKKLISERVRIELERENYYSTGENQYWNKNVFENPENLNFWFDFLDAEGELSQFSVKAIGHRAKSVNDSTITAIYFRETPEVIFQKAGEELPAIGAYKSIQVPDVDKMFSISAQGKSAKDKLDELLYQHGYCNESVSITTVPIFYLQPNTRIHIQDEKTNLNGDYIIGRISFSLAYNGTMSITATKAVKDLL